MRSAKEVIVETLFEWGGSGQGVDDVLEGIATSQADTVIAALSAAGYVIVPREPTQAMAEKANMSGPYDHSGGWWGPHYYRAMIAQAEKEG